MFTEAVTLSNHLIQYTSLLSFWFVLFFFFLTGLQSFKTCNSHSWPGGRFGQQASLPALFLNFFKMLFLYLWLHWVSLLCVGFL